MTLPVHAGQKSDVRSCAACGSVVDRSELHKNRYAQYICRQCRSAGVRFVGIKHVSHLFSKTPAAIIGMIVGAVAVLLLLAVLLLVSTLYYSYSLGDLIEALKTLVRSVNKMAH